MFTTKRKITKTFALIAAVAAMTFAGNAQAQDGCTYPERPVSLVVGYAPGGGTDTAARIVATRISEFANGQPFNVVNRPGGAQVPAMKFTMGAEKDGYTLQFFSAGSAMLATMIRDHGFTWLGEFEPISMVSATNDTVVVNKASGITTAAELIEAIKTAADNGDKLRWGHAGRGGVTHIAGAAWLDVNGLAGQVQDVPFEGSGKARVALLGQQIDFAVLAVSNVDEFKDELAGIGVLSDERDGVVDYVPTMAEQGIPFVTVDLPIVLAAPKGVPQEVIDCLSAAAEKMVATEGYREAMSAAGLGPVYRDAPTTTAAMQRRYDDWSPVVQQLMADK